MAIRSRAPLRISFGGGGTDIPPYPEERGGATLSTTINKYAYATIIPRDDELLNVTSLDYDFVARHGANGNSARHDHLDIVKAATKVMHSRRGTDIYLHSDARPGTGLGGSSAQIVAVVGAFQHWLKLPFTDYDIAETGYRIENEELGNHSGRQDQYAATFGGFNLIEFRGDNTVVNPLRIKDDILNELQYRLILCYTGKVRVSAGIIAEQVSRYVQGDEDTIRALDETKALAYAMKDALLLGRIDEFGSLLNKSWSCKKRFSGKITDSEIDRLYEVAIQHGAIGGKLLGAGGGGCFLLLCEFDKKHLVAQKLEEMGGEVIDFAFDLRGLQVWETR